jgi:outer membrane cobalamin receptor
VIFRSILPRWLFAALLLLSSIDFSMADAPPLTPLDVQVLTREDFVARNYMSVAEALRGRTSLKIEQDGYRGTRAVLKMRGLARADDVLILLDGRPLNHEFDGNVDLSQIPLEMVDRIEITRGGGSVLYSAQAVAGVVNIITLRPERKGLVVDLGTGIGRHGAKNADGRFLARSNYGDMTFIPTNHTAGGFSANEDYNAKSYFGNFTRSFNGKGYWGAEYFYNTSRVGLSNGTEIPFDQWNRIVEQNPSTPDPQRTQELQHAKAFFAYPLLDGGTTYATVTQSWHENEDRATRGGIAVLDKHNRSTTADLMWRKNAFSVGYQSRALERTVFDNPNRQTAENSFFAARQFTWKHATLVPGVRYEHGSRTGGFVAPRLALSYSPESEWLFSTTVQRSHRVPTFDEFFSTTNARDTALDDEKIYSSDLGAQWKPSDKFDARVGGFYTHVDDVIGQNAALDWVNDGTERAMGVETELHWNSRPGNERRYESRLSWTVQHSRTRLDESSAWVPSAMTPHHLLDVRLDKHMPRNMVFSNELRYQTQQFELPNEQGLKLPHFLIWNTRFALRILAADMYVAVDNIMNVPYAETFATAPETTGNVSVLSPQPARTYWTGISIRFID